MSNQRLRAPSSDATQRSESYEQLILEAQHQLDSESEVSDLLDLNDWEDEPHPQHPPRNASNRTTPRRLQRRRAGGVPVDPHSCEDSLSMGGVLLDLAASSSRSDSPMPGTGSPASEFDLYRSIPAGRPKASSNFTANTGLDSFNLGLNSFSVGNNAAPSAAGAQSHRRFLSRDDHVSTAADTFVSRPQGHLPEPAASNHRIRSPIRSPILRSRAHIRRRVSGGNENRMPRSLSQGGGAPYSLNSILSPHNNQFEPSSNPAEFSHYSSPYSNDPSLEFSASISQGGGGVNGFTTTSTLSPNISHSQTNRLRPTASSFDPGVSPPSSDAQDPLTIGTNNVTGTNLRGRLFQNWLDVQPDSDDEMEAEHFQLAAQLSNTATGGTTLGDNWAMLRLVDSLAQSEPSERKRNDRLRLNVNDVNAMKRPRDKSEPTLTNSMDLMNALAKKGAVSIFLYHKEYPNPEGTDVWPDIRDGSKIPARYFRLSGGTSIPAVAPDKSRGYCLREPLRPNKILKLKAHSPQQIQQPRKGWPASVVPTEMFEEIARYLSRDDIKSMRLVCREFDRHVSQVLFNTVVVPFNTEIYGMLGTDKKPDIKGKGKVKMEVNKPLSWKNANGDDVYNGHGLDVFRGFGPHIRKYGMSFDVDEDALAKPPYKGTTQGYVSFWGTYDWPFEEYRRFDDVAGLELAADETPRMKTAFSMLQRVQELAFSVDSGLGWLRGPDRSIRARVLQRSPQVFGSSKNIPDRKTQAQKELWDYIEATHRDVELDVKLATLYRMDLSRPFSELQSVLDSKTISSSQPRYPFMDLHLIGEATPDDVQEAAIPSFDDLDSLEAFIGPHQTPATGILYSATSSPNEAAQLKSSIIPAQLTKAQKEWLLETEWAQRAFLSSYMLAVIDNPSTFERVHTLNIARVSSRYTFSLCRQDFWDALPQLKTVTIQVIPDWRGVLKDEAGFVETPRITPAQAIGPFHQLLKEMISPRANIQALTIGWAAGGEHAEGVHARNKHILPAPVLPDHASLLLFPSQLSEHMLYLPHVKKLTLKNCWITPPALQQVVETHEKTKLENLVLDSVSLTATPRTLANQNQNQNQNFNLQANPPPAIAPQQANAAGNLANALQNVQNAHAQQVPGHHLAPQHLLALQIQALQLQIQHLQTQQTAHAQTQINSLQAQMQTQVHLQAQLHAHGMAMNPPPQAPPPQQFTPQSAVRANHREGSWPYIIDIISPGQSLAAFGSDYSNADPDRITTLNQLEFISCGYVRLPHANIDQAALEPAVPMIRLPHFTKRYNALVPAMLSSKDPLLGEIIQEVEPVEVAALNAAWFLVPGWRDQFEAKGPEFDGLLPGGSGRFSGIIKKGDRGVIDGEDGLRG